MNKNFKDMLLHVLSTNDLCIRNMTKDNIVKVYDISNYDETRLEPGELYDGVFINPGDGTIPRIRIENVFLEHVTKKTYDSIRIYDDIEETRTYIRVEKKLEKAIEFLHSAYSIEINEKEAQGYIKEYIKQKSIK